MRNINEVYINGICLEEILKKHKRWLNNEEGGERADLQGVDLRNVDFSDVDLSYANFRGANFSEANFRGSNFRGSDFRRANFRRANFRGTDFRNANCEGANFLGANLPEINFKGTNLDKIKYNEKTSFYALQCPEKGSFIGFKKAGGKIVELLISEDAKRSSSTSRKCRCSKAKVLSITSIDGTKKYKEVCSDRDMNFVYKVGEIMKVDNFDEDRWNECTTGIHFFITRQEAVNY